MNSRDIVCLFILHLAAMFRQCHTQTLKEEYCSWEDFEARCGDGQVIMLKSAFYGRLRKGRCVTRDFGYLGCGKDVTSQVDAQCSGRQQCQFPVMALHGEHGCSHDLTPYLIADYSCIRATGCSKEACDASEYLHVPDTSGHVASSLASSTGCGTARCPWLIEAKAGQHINVTLYDFGAVQSSDVCHWYFVIYDGNVRKDITQCESSREREQHIYTSVSNVLRIELSQFDQQEEAPIFVVQYEATGCPDVEPPAHSAVARNGDQVSISCLYSSSAWHLTCSASKWVGNIGTCPGLKESGAQIDPNTGQIMKNPGSSPFGMVLIIGVGIALGVAIGVVLLCFVVIYMKQKQRGSSSKPSPLLRDTNQYRNYLAKSMAGNVANLQANNAIIYTPEHDYTSTLHPPPRTLGETLPPPPPPFQHNPALQPFHDEPNATTNADATRYNSYLSQRTGAHGSTDSLTTTIKYNQGRFKEHIYELPKFPETNRAQSADAAIAYSAMKTDGQTNNRTT